MSRRKADTALARFLESGALDDVDDALVLLRDVYLSIGALGDQLESLHKHDVLTGKRYERLAKLLLRAEGAISDAEEILVGP